MSRAIERRLVSVDIPTRVKIEIVQDGILILDADTGQITDVNPFLVNMLGSIRMPSCWVNNEDLPLEASDGRCLHVEFVGNVYHIERDAFSR
jgi:hypothetical protein